MKIGGKLMLLSAALCLAVLAGGCNFDLESSSVNKEVEKQNGQPNVQMINEGENDPSEIDTEPHENLISETAIDEKSAALEKRIEFKGSQIQRNGFDMSSNNIDYFAGLKLVLPDYWGDLAQTDEMLMLNADEDVVPTVSLMIFIDDAPSESPQDFISQRDQYLKNEIQESKEFAQTEGREWNGEYSSPEIIEYASMKGFIYYETSYDYSHECQGFATYVVLFCEEESKLYKIALFENEKSKYDYLDDFMQSLVNMEYIGQSNIETTTQVTTLKKEHSTSDEEKTTATSKKTTYKTETQSTYGYYILNTNTMKIHYETCKEVSHIKDENKQGVTDTLENLYAQGYTPCGKCHPH